MWSPERQQSDFTAAKCLRRRIAETAVNSSTRGQRGYMRRGKSAREIYSAPLKPSTKSHHIAIECSCSRR